MTNVSNYLDLVAHDLRLFNLLTGPLPAEFSEDDFSDWQVTILFYMACIFLKSACAFLGEDIEDHYTLRRIINDRREFFSIARNYRHLEEASRDARYEGRVFAKDYIKERLVPKFNSVRDCIVKLLAENSIPNIPIVEVDSLLCR